MPPALPQVLLPPSEAKHAGGRGRPMRRRLDPDAPLDAARLRVVGALDALLAKGDAAAATALLLPAAPAARSLAVNATVLDSPTTPALRRYAGVVYEGLDAAGLDPTAQRIAARTVLIFSGLWGVVGGDEPVPDYRVTAKATLPGIGVAATFWRPVLHNVLGPRLSDGLIVDLRSGDYAAMWRPPRELADRVVVVRVVSPLPRGGHGVISYASKLAKGQLTRAIVLRAASGAPVAAAADVLAAWRSCDGAGGAVTGPGRIELRTG